MRKLLLILSLAVVPGMAKVKQNPSPNQDKRSEEVGKRGEHVMGFSHEATTHHFRLFSDGGEIDVTVNDAKDKASIDQIRTHLGLCLAKTRAGLNTFEINSIREDKTGACIEM